MTGMRSIVVLIIGVALGACSKKDPGPSCEQVVDHMLEITKQQLVGHDNVVFASQKKAMVAQCESRNMAAEMRTCLLGTQTISDIAKCRGGKTDVIERPRRAIRPLKPPGARGELLHPRSGAGSAGAIAGSGSGDGKVVAPAGKIDCPLVRRLPSGGCAPDTGTSTSPPTHSIAPDTKTGTKTECPPARRMPNGGCAPA